MSILRRSFVMTGAAAALAGRSADAASSAMQPNTPAPLSLQAGVMLPLSGPQALTGDECLRGVEMAVNDINAAGGIAGRILSLRRYDAYADAPTAQAAQSAMTANPLAFMLGTGSSTFSYPASAAAELLQLPYIEISAEADGVTSRGFRYLLRTTLTTSMVAAVAVSAINARYLGRKIGLLFNTGAAAGAIAAAALASWTQTKTPIALSIGYSETIADLRDQIGRLQRAGVEVLLHAASADDVILAFAAMRDTSWQPGAIFGCGEGYETRETAEALAGGLDGVFVSAAPFYPPRAKYLAEAYRETYVTAPRSPASLTCYVGAKMVFDVLNMVRGDPAKLLDALRHVDIGSGTLVNGWGASFDKSGQNTRCFALLQQWRNQNLVVAA